MAFLSSFTLAQQRGSVRVRFTVLTASLFVFVVYTLMSRVAA